MSRMIFFGGVIAVPIKRVNPLDLDSVDQIHAPAGPPQAMADHPTDRDLV